MRESGGGGGGGFSPLLCPDGCCQVGLIGEPVDLTYKYTHLGTDAASISKLAAGGPFLELLQKAQHPVVVVGPGVLQR